MTARILDQRNADRLPEPAYDRDGITVYLGDCRTILPLLDAVDHVITDPPYEAEAHTQGRRGNTARDGVAAYSSTRALDFDPIDAEMRTLVGLEMARLSTGWVLVFCQVEAAMLWRDALHPARYCRTQIWRKPNAPCQFTGDRPGMGYESIVTAWAGAGRSEWNGGGRHGVYELMVARHVTEHMTEKPIALMRELVELFTDPGDLVLDPFAGSLTTAVACKQLGRRCIAIEMDAGYVQAGIKRLEATTLPLFVLAPEVVTQEGLGL